MSTASAPRDKATQHKPVPLAEMTLRDFFAGMVLCGAGAQSHYTPERRAAAAFELADAMLATRGEP